MRGEGNRMTRLWRLVEKLRVHRLGLRAVVLARQLGVSPATLHRDLAILRDAGVPITSDTCNGEVRHRLDREALPPLQLSADQLRALKVGRQALVPLEGTRLVDEFDAILAQAGIDLASAPAPEEPHIAAPPVQISAVVMTAVEAALRHRLQLEIEYRAASRQGQRQRYLLDPVKTYWLKGALYLGAFDRVSVRYCRYKLTRIEEARVLSEPADAHPDASLDALFGRGAKLWVGDELEVAILLDATAAWRAREYPLANDQTLEPTPDGRVLIRARVAPKPARSWTLSWGSLAVVVSPPELRDLIRADALAIAAHHTGGPDPALGPAALPATPPELAATLTAPPLKPGVRTARRPPSAPQAIEADDSTAPASAAAAATGSGKKRAAPGRRIRSSHGR